MHPYGRTGRIEEQRAYVCGCGREKESRRAADRDRSHTHHGLFLRPRESIEEHREHDRSHPDPSRFRRTRTDQRRSCQRSVPDPVGHHGRCTCGIRFQRHVRHNGSRWFKGQGIRRCDDQSTRLQGQGNRSQRRGNRVDQEER